jgi:DNA-directed RNA polymerase subunit beta'
MIRPSGTAPSKSAWAARSSATCSRELDIVAMANKLRTEMKETTSEPQRRKFAKRLKIVEGVPRLGQPPRVDDARGRPGDPAGPAPMVQLDGGRFATSDLNDLYRRVINRNNRLKRLQDLNAPEIIIRNEKRMLQEAVDALFDNGRRGKARSPARATARSSRSPTCSRASRAASGRTCSASASTTRAVRSSSSAPSSSCTSAVCPRRWPSSSSSPSSDNKLVERRLRQNIKSAKKMVEKEKEEVWDILEEVIKEHPVMLNRAPTLHRLGIQAFEPC